MTRGSGIGLQLFPSMFDAMKTLLIGGIMPDLYDIVDAIGKEEDFGWFHCSVFLIYIFIAALTIMNMLVGVLVDVVRVVATVEGEAMSVSNMKVQLLHILDLTEEEADGDFEITKEDFKKILMRQGCARALQDTGVDVVGLVDICDMIFRDVKSLCFEDLMQVMLSLRGHNTATVKDIVDLRKFMIQEHVDLLTKFNKNARESAQSVFVRASSLRNTSMHGPMQAHHNSFCQAPLGMVVNESIPGCCNDIADALQSTDGGLRGAATAVISCSPKNDFTESELERPVQRNDGRDRDGD